MLLLTFKIILANILFINIFFANIFFVNALFVNNLFVNILFVNILFVNILLTIFFFNSLNTFINVWPNKLQKAFKVCYSSFIQK